MAAGVILSCNSPTKPVEGTGNLEGYELSSMPGTQIQKAMKLNADGNPVETGYTLNGKRTGTWVTFFNENGRINSISSYANGNLDGVSITFNNRGQIEKKAFYSNNILDGMSATYKFGRPEQEQLFKNGKLDGMTKTYYTNGKLQKEIEFKDGLQDGIFKYYDEQGNVTLDYLYKNGEKVSGGIVTPPSEE
jgi:antitoxin component YwqK of YwqJK toxin-antitoxin module